MNKINTETHFKGLAVSSGIVIAKICLFNEGRHNNLPNYKVDGFGIEKEKNRYEKATALVSNQLEILIKNIREKIGKAEAEIFAVQKLILQDPSIREKIIKEIETKNINAETAIAGILDFYESKILKLDNEYIKERASDIGEIKRRLLDVLGNLNPSLQCAGEPHCQRGKNKIIVAVELTPGLTMDLDTKNTLGIITERGGPASHAAILARALKIPAVSGIKNIHSLLFCGTEVLINGYTGEIIIWPSKKTLSKYSSMKESSSSFDPVNPVKGFKVMANLNLSKDVQEVKEFQAEGIGLYRTEFEFLSSNKLLNEKEQYHRYSHVLKEMKGNSVYFRLLDIGGDKTASFFKLPSEQNPYLGFRGSRLLLGRPKLLKTQVRALGKASKFGTVHIMYPMIIDVEQFLKLKNFIIENTSDISPLNLKHGVMFEVPSACYQATELLNAADFGSIGSNDLIQYFFAVDRNNELVAYDYTPEKEIFWNFLKQIVIAAKKTKKTLSFCGEIAGNPKYIAKLQEIGINTVSVSSRLITGIREEVLKIKKF